MTLVITDTWFSRVERPFLLTRGLGIGYIGMYAEYCVIIDTDTQSAYYAEVPSFSSVNIDCPYRSDELNRLSGCHDWYFHCHIKRDGQLVVSVSYRIPSERYWMAEWSQRDGDRIDFELCYYSWFIRGYIICSAPTATGADCSAPTATGADCSAPTATGADCNAETIECTTDK